ncbi:MAG: FecR family protein [Bacteroidota bacterium]|jgi:ferric-dicitrate binding protein FerR (iron transport regulator)
MKSRLPQALNTLFRIHESPDAAEAKIQDALSESASRLRTIDPQTQQQWLRLERATRRSDTEAVPYRPRLVPRLAFGAAAVAIVAAAIYFSTSSPQSSPGTFATRMGEQKEVVLGDGSQITLNYASELVAPAQRPNEPRRVSLTGEAYFRIRHTGSPFILTTQSANIEVVGTEFNVWERDGSVEVGVVSGAVKVRVVKDGKDSTLLLTQNQMALCPRDAFPHRLASISSPEYPGWMHGKLLLDRTQFITACRELEMRFGVTIDVRDTALREKMITGILDARTAASGLSALCQLTGKEFTHAGKTYIIH